MAAEPNLENDDLKDARARPGNDAESLGAARRGEPAVALMSHKERGTRITAKRNANLSRQRRLHPRRCRL